MDNGVNVKYLFISYDICTLSHPYFHNILHLFNINLSLTFYIKILRWSSYKRMFTLINYDLLEFNLMCIIFVMQ